jgi:hypothetical protein
MAVLQSFHRAQEAEYQHGSWKGCLEGTRIAVLDQVELWTRDPSRPPIYWLNGLAGTGKSTIAQTIAERMFADRRLGGSFFCSRDSADRSNLQLIFQGAEVGERLGLIKLTAAAQATSSMSSEEPVSLGARGGVLTQYITNTLQGNGQRT